MNAGRILAALAGTGNLTALVILTHHALTRPKEDA